MSNYPEGVSMPFLDDALDFIDCDECGKEVGANEVTTIEGRVICDGCNPNTCTCEEVDVDAPGPFGPSTIAECENCKRNWKPTTLTEVAVRDFGLRESGERI